MSYSYKLLSQFILWNAILDATLKYKILLLGIKKYKSWIKKYYNYK